MENFNEKIDLLKLKGSFMTNIKGTKSTKRCLVIPVDDASLYVGEKGVYLDLNAYTLREQKGNTTHIVKQNLPRDVRQGMTEEERRALPILGDIRVMEQREVTMNVTNSMDASWIQPDSDDGDGLPF